MPPNNNFMPSTPLPTKRSFGLIIGLLFTILLLIGALIFGVWAFGSRQDYKDNVDKKIEAAVTTAKQQQTILKDQEFQEKEKSPFKAYTGPGQYGSVHIVYPKTWSAYVIDGANGNTPLDGYFHPNFVPNVQNTNSGVGFAIRVQVVATAYDQVLKGFDAAIKNGKATVSPYKAEKVANVSGARIDGEIVTGKQGSMVIFPLRDKTIMVWTEAAQFSNDFNTIILPNLTFIP